MSLWRLNLQTANVNFQYCGEYFICAGQIVEVVAVILHDSVQGAGSAQYEFTGW